MQFDRIKPQLNKFVFRAKISKGSVPMIFRLSERSFEHFCSQGSRRNAAAFPYRKGKRQERTASLSCRDCLSCASYGKQSIFV